MYKMVQGEAKNHFEKNRIMIELTIYKCKNYQEIKYCMSHILILTIFKPILKLL